jgi:hypothetical protein
VRRKILTEASGDLTPLVISAKQAAALDESTPTRDQMKIMEQVCQ